MTTTETPDSGTEEEKPWHLSGNNAPIFDEATVTELEVKGSIPPNLKDGISETELILNLELQIIGSLEMEWFTELNFPTGKPIGIEIVMSEHLCLITLIKTGWNFTWIWKRWDSITR